MTPADRVRIMADLGLSDPLPVQYVHWLRDIAAGRLGKSFFRGDTVSELIAPPRTDQRRDRRARAVRLLADRAARGHPQRVQANSIPDGVARMLSILFIAIGILARLLIVLASLFWFGYKTPIIIVHAWESPWQNLQIVIGPAVVRGLAQGAYIARCHARACWRSSARTSSHGACKGLREGWS